MLYYRYCPSWLLCFKKMTVNDISGSDYSRDDVNVPVTRDAAELVFSHDEYLSPDPIHKVEAIERNGSALSEKENAPALPQPNGYGLVGNDKHFAEGRIAERSERFENARRSSVGESDADTSSEVCGVA